MTSDTDPATTAVSAGWDAHTQAFGPPRFGQGPLSTAVQLGPLASLAGSWRGDGFNAMWRPDNGLPPANSQIHRFLELNRTNESFDFHIIPGAVPNRGFNTQADLSLYGLHYLQRVSDADRAPFSTAGQALHIEPGLFMNVPASQIPPTGPAIARLASIPHGVTVLMQGPAPSATPVDGPPDIPVLVPFSQVPAGTLGRGVQPVNTADGSLHTVAELNVAADAAFPASQSNGPFPGSSVGPPLVGGPFQNFINDPNSVLRRAINGQDILGTITISLSATGAGSGIENIPFLGIPNLAGVGNPASATEINTVPNAFVYSVDATFWIEWVRIPYGYSPAFPPAAAAAKAGPNAAPIAVPSLPDEIRLIEPYWDQPTFLQLQYSQLVILIFNNVLWPHVTVATLTLSAG